MNKRTFARYLNLCYLSPKIVADILEYRNPRNLSLKEVMTLAEGKVVLNGRKKNGIGCKVDPPILPVREQGPLAGLSCRLKYLSETGMDKKLGRTPSEGYS